MNWVSLPTQCGIGLKTSHKLLARDFGEYYRGLYANRHGKWTRLGGLDGPRLPENRSQSLIWPEKSPFCLIRRGFQL